MTEHAAQNEEIRALYDGNLDGANNSHWCAPFILLYISNKLHTQVQYFLNLDKQELSHKYCSVAFITQLKQAYYHSF